MGIHALAIHDVVLLLQRHLRIAGATGTHHGAEGGAGGSADRRAVTTADRRAEPRSQRRAEKRASYSLVIGGGGAIPGLCTSILLAGHLIGGKSIE